MRTVIVAILLLFSCGSLWAQTGGSISGTVKDPTGGAIPDTAVIARNVDTQVGQTVNTNAEGFFAFPTLAVGHYELETFRPGFKPYKRTGLAVDVNTKLQVDIELEVGEQSEQVTVTETADVQVETRKHADGRRRHRPGDDRRRA